MELKDVIAAWIRGVRKSANLSGTELGTRLTFEINNGRSYSRANISHWETGTFMPTILELVAIRKLTNSFFPKEITGINVVPAADSKPPAQIMLLPERRSDPRSLTINTEQASRYYPVPSSKFHQVGVFGKGMGGIPDRLWNDADFIVGFSDKFSEIATQDENAFLISIEGLSMAPKYTPKNYALIEPNTAPEIGDDVLVRLKSGETLLKKLAARKAGRITLESYNDPELIKKREEDVLWMYYVAYPVPARKIKSRT